MVSGMGMGQPMRGYLRPGNIGSRFGLLEDEALPAGMRDLDGGRGPVGLDGVAQKGQSGEVVHPRDTELARGRPAVQVVHPRVLDDHHGAAALRHLFVVAEQALGDGAIGIGKAGVLRRLDDAVLERDVPDPAGLEQTGESCFPFVMTPVFLRSA